MLKKELHHSSIVFNFTIYFGACVQVLYRIPFYIKYILYMYLYTCLSYAWFYFSISFLFIEFNTIEYSVVLYNSNLNFNLNCISLVDFFNIFPHCHSFTTVVTSEDYLILKKCPFIIIFLFFFVHLECVQIQTRN